MICVITTSIGLLGVPFFSLILSYYLLHEPITFAKAIAMALILLAMVISVCDDRLKKVALHKA